MSNITQQLRCTKGNLQAYYRVTLTYTDTDNEKYTENLSEDYNGSLVSVTNPLTIVTISVSLIVNRPFHPSPSIVHADTLPQ